MEKFSEFYNKFKCNRCFLQRQEEMLMESLDGMMNEKQDPGSEFTTMHHYTEEELKAGLDKIDAEYETTEDMVMEDEEDTILEEEKKTGKSHKEQDTILVKNGVFQKTKGRAKDIAKIISGEVKKAHGQERLDMLQNGWSDYYPIHKKNEDGTVERLGVDRKLVNDFKSKGYELGWGEETHLFNKKTMEKKLIYSSDLEEYMNPNEPESEGDWKIFEPMFVSKNKTTKKNTITTDIRKIDKTQLATWEEQGYQSGINHPEEYFNSISIAENGGKVATANMSLTPGPKGSCPSDVPCGNICYAMKQYEQYPACKEAWDKNFEIVKNHLDWLERDIEEFFKRHKRIKLFRWHVAGDIVNAKHLEIINNIATNHKDVTFWLYTKNIDALKEFGTNHAPNLTILISAWNAWRIDEIDGEAEEKTDEKGNKVKTYKHDGSSGLHEHYPVAYFDDFSHKDLIPDDEHSYVCKCANYTLIENEKDLKCKTCKTDGAMMGDKSSHPCYTLKGGESMIFRQH